MLFIILLIMIVASSLIGGIITSAVIVVLIRPTAPVSAAKAAPELPPADCFERCASAAALAQLNRRKAAANIPRTFKS